MDDDCAVLRDTFALVGDGFLRQLVCRLAAAADVRYAFATGPVDATVGATLRTRRFGFWLAEEFGLRFQFRAADRRWLGLPRPLTTADYPGLLGQLFTGERRLAELAPESCLTVALRSAKGRVLGHLGVLDPGRAASAEEAERMLAILAPRAATEMERLATERTYRRALARMTAARRRKRNELVRACAWCKRVQDVGDDWQEVEAYLRKRFRIDFTHGICAACLRLHPLGEAQRC
jgi:hypothetical protein